MQYTDAYAMTSSTSTTASGVTPSHGHAPHLSISTQSLQSNVTSPVQTPHSATSQFGSFSIHQQYGATPQHYQHHHQHSQGFMSPQGFQTLVSPTQSHFADAPQANMAQVAADDSPLGEAYVPPSGAALAGRGTRKAAGSWR